MLTKYSFLFLFLFSTLVGIPNDKLHKAIVTGALIEATQALEAGADSTNTEMQG